MSFIPKAFACASCGSGSGDPLILYPNEQVKLYFATRYLSIPAQLQTDGKKAPNYLSDQQAFFDLGLGLRLSSRFFTSLYWGGQLNHGRRNELGMQDPLIKARWTLLEQTFHTPLRPQVQILFGYKSNLARDKFESQDPQLLDVFGNGHQEIHLGYDLWNANLSLGNFPLLVGMGQTIVLPLMRTVEGIGERPGYGLGSVATLGTFYQGANKLLLGYFLNLRGERQEDGESIQESTSRSHAVFSTIDYAIDMKTSLRATATLSGLGKSYNTTKTRTIIVSLNKTLF